MNQLNVCNKFSEAALNFRGLLYNVFITNVDWTVWILAAKRSLYFILNAECNYGVFRHAFDIETPLFYIFDWIIGFF